MSADSVRRHSESPNEASLSSRQLRLLLDTPRVIGWRGPIHDMRFTAVDAHAEELLGFPLQDWYHPDFWRTRTHPDDRSAVLAAHERASRGDGDFISEHRLLARDGGVVRIRAVGSQTVGGIEAPAFSGLLLDVTQITNARALNDYRERLAMATAAGRVGIWEMNLESGTVETDAVMPSLLGFEAEELRGHSDWMSRVHAEDRERVRQYERALRDGQGFPDLALETPSIDYRVMHRDGTVRWIRSVARVTRDAGGRPNRVVGAVRDVSEHLRQREHRAAEDELSRAVLASFPGNMAIIDAIGTIVAVNEAWREFHRATGDEASTSTSLGASYLASYAKAAVFGDATATQAVEGIKSVLSGEAESFRLEYVSPAAERDRWFVMLVHRLRRQGGGAVVAHLDVTQRKKAELELQEARQELARAAQYAAAGELISAITHDLRQPLTSIRMNAQAAVHMIEPARPELADVRDALKDIVEEDEHAVEILHVVRDLVAHREPKWESVDLNAICRSVARLVASEAVARRAAVSLALDEQLPVVVGDRAQLRQATLSLVLNALEICSSGNPSSRVVTIATRARDRARAELSVRCPPIPADVAAGPPPGPTGLAFVRAVAEAHRGYALSDDDASAGTEVRIVLPAVVEPAGGHNNDQ